MIKKKFLFPECFIQKIPICDDCNTILQYTNVTLTSNPPLEVYKCPKCNKEYHISQNELVGEWKWKTI